MEQLVKEIAESVEREYGRAAAKFGCLNNSDHESYAVIKEELEEAQEEFEYASRHFTCFWDMVKLNGDDKVKLCTLKRLQHCAELAAAEMVQVAAMAKKAAITVCDRNAKEELGCVSTSESTPVSPAPLPSSQFTETDIEKLKSKPFQNPNTFES